MKHPEFAKRFTEAVSTAGVSTTQKSLAKLLGVSEVMIWSYRNGEKLPRMSTALRISEILNVSVLWLLQGDQESVEPSMIKESPAAIYKTMTISKSVENIATFCENLPKRDQKKALALLKREFPQKES